MSLSPRQRWYREVYLQSPEWKAIRRTKAKRTNKRCAICASDREIDLHHLFYRRDLSETQPSDLRWLCRTCHTTAHQLLAAGKIAPRKATNHHVVFACTKEAVKKALGLTGVNLFAAAASSAEVPDGVITLAWIDSKRTSAGGFSKEALASMGVAWPPPRGWRKALLGKPLP